ncbi:MAG: hypothetical protein KC435_08120 [Thermomicrobiales bacterium]|nr:hypothetical protein [Thermomicrobiales bacterium]
MSSPNDDDTFTMQFDDAVNSMHQRLISAPGTQIWQQIEGRMASDRSPRGKSRSIVGDLAGDSGSSHVYERKATMDATLSTPIQPERTYSTPVWMAVAAVALLVVSGLYLNLIKGNSEGEQNLAWAPAAVESTPVGDYACTVEPLTADEVMAIVLNPTDAYVARGETPIDADFPMTYYEAGTSDINNWTEVSMNPAIGEDQETMAAFGNEFWNCLITGTSYQIWAMTDPATLQWAILKNFPVIRSEEELRKFVEDIGPKLYMDGQDGYQSFGIFPNFLNQDPADVARVADRSEGSIRVSKPRGETGNQSTIGIITMVPASGENPFNYFELYVTGYPDGSWGVNWTMPNMNQSRG